MAMSKKRRSKQESTFVATHTLVKSPGHPFYEKLNEMLSAEKLAQRYDLAAIGSALNQVKISRVQDRQQKDLE